MAEELEQNDQAVSPQTEPDAVALIKKMQHQLVLLEKKIDILIDQSARKPFGEKNFSRPGRSFGRPHRSYGREHGDASGEKRFDRGRHFEKRHGEEGRSFDHKKKSFGDSRGGDFSRERSFEKRQDGPKGGFDYKKKPFSYKRKTHR